MSGGKEASSMALVAVSETELTSQIGGIDIKSPTQDCMFSQLKGDICLSNKSPGY